jgi:alpha-ribazole phosphatase
MPLYLIRHTTPDINKGTCYGQSDIGLMDSFDAEASVVKTFVPGQIHRVYSSPLIRCKRLAEYLFPENAIAFEKDLMEIHCGQWEMKAWDDIPKKEIDPWMQDFVQSRIPGGESYIDLYKRVTGSFNKIAEENTDVAVITHGGVIRSILSYITQTSLSDSFKIFTLHYGCVVKIDIGNGVYNHTMLSNIEKQKEQHKPTHF